MSTPQPFVFHPNATNIGVTYTPEEEIMSTSMQTYWATFAATGVPASPATGPDAGLVWPTYNQATGAPQSSMFISTPNQVQDGAWSTICDWYDVNVGYDFP